MARLDSRHRTHALRLTALALGLALFAGACAQATDVPSASGGEKASAKTVTRTAKVPHWITAGYAMAEREIASREPLTRPDLTAPKNTSNLPSKAEFVATMLAAGINNKSAECIYDNISTGAVADNAAKLINALQKVGPSQRGQVTQDSLGQLDQGEIQQMLVAIAPCLDTQTLVVLLAALGGKDALGGTSIDAALAGLSTPQLAAILASSNGATDPSALLAAAAAAGVTLTPAQAQALSAAALAGAAGKANPKNIDFSNLEPGKLGPEGVASLLFAVAAGLTETQRQQLVRLANVNLAKVDLSVDPKTLTKEQTGALFLVLLPFISTQVAPGAGGAPPGVDPGQVYIPPGADLSSINPINFISRENLVAGLAAQGISAASANCMYDRLRAIDPRLIGLAFTGGDFNGTSQFLLTIVGCVISS